MNSITDTSKHTPSRKVNALCVFWRGHIKESLPLLLIPGLKSMFPDKVTCIHVKKT